MRRPITMVLFAILIGITFIQMRLMRAGEADWRRMEMTSIYKPADFGCWSFS